MSRSEIFSIDKIMKLTNNGEDIFQQELGTINSNRNIPSPFRNDKDNDSFRIKQNKMGNWTAIDYGGDNWSGNAISFVMKLYNLNLPQAINKIVEDLGLVQKSRNYTKIDIIQSKKQKVISPVLYEFNAMPFSKQHHEYFNQYELSEDFITKEGDIYAVNKWAIDKSIQKFTHNEIVFCYVYRDIEGRETGRMKFLRIGPDIEKKNKWRTNVENNKIWYSYKYKNKVPVLFVGKSNKDALCMIQEGIPSINTQSENDVILRKNIPILQQLADKLIMNYGNDPQSVKASKNITDEFGMGWFNVPANVYDFGAQDNSDYIKEFGRERFRKLLNLKGFFTLK